MNKHTLELAKQAGFVFWGNEAWGPGPGNIDWSCDYSDEFEKFAKLVRQERVEIQEQEINKLNQLIEKEYGFKIQTEPLSEAVKSWTITTEEDPETGDIILPLPDELLDQMPWREGDTLEFRDNHDGSFTLSKKQETELVMVDTVSTYRIRYAVEVPKGKTHYALDTVTLEEAKEFSQEHIGEQIMSYRVVTEAEALKMCDEENSYCTSWTDELKKKIFFTSIEDQNPN